MRLPVPRRAEQPAPVEVQLDPAILACLPGRLLDDPRLGEQGERRPELLLGLGGMPFGPDGEELGELRVVDPQDRQPAVEIQQQELVEPAGDRTPLVQVEPEAIVEGGREEGVEVVQVPVGEPDEIGLGRPAVGEFRPQEADPIVEVKDLLPGADPLPGGLRVEGVVARDRSAAVEAIAALSRSTVLPEGLMPMRRQRSRQPHVIGLRKGKPWSVARLRNARCADLASGPG